MDTDTQQHEDLVHRTTTSDTDLIEWESTITVKITPEEYDAVRKFKSDVIFLFDNDVRLSNKRIEEKVMERQYIFGFLKGHKFPIIRSKATERLAEIPEHGTIVRVNNRKVKLSTHNIRVSYNCIEKMSSRRYTVSYEIEYPVNTPCEEIRKHETRLMEMALSHHHIPKANISTLESVAPCISSKVEMWHVFKNTKNYKWAYKWNGIRAKLLLCEDSSNLVYISPSASTIKTARIYGQNIDLLRDMCLSVEIMHDRMVIIEILGSKFEDQMYKVEVSTNLEILKYLGEKLGSDVFVDKRPLIVQKFYDAPKPATFDRNLFDGLIIVENDTIIKWKIPTVDVKCVGPHKFTVGDNTILTLKECGVKGRVYEISPDYEILRMRNDRLNDSNENEYQVFLKSREFICSNNDNKV